MPASVTPKSEPGRSPTVCNSFSPAAWCLSLTPHGLIGWPRILGRDVYGAAMGEVDLHFRPSVPVFDANVALGRRHDRRVTADTVDALQAEMRRVGVGRALVYSAHSAAFDTGDGNDYLLEMVEGAGNLVPQLACSPAVEDLDRFAAQVDELSIRSVRMFPIEGGYPFRSWIVGPWMEWLASENLALWLPAHEVDPGELHDTLREHPGVAVVLSDVHYVHVPWIYPLLRSLPNVQVEISRFVVPDGMTTLIDAAGHERVLFGSRFPDSAMAPQLYNLHRCGLDEAVLAAVCAGNLDRLLSHG